MKSAIKFLSLLFIVLFVINCEKDDSQTIVEHNGGHGNATLGTLKISPITNDDIVDNNTLSQKILSLDDIKSHQESSNLKSVYNQDYNFTIHTTKGNYIEDGDYHSYTFSVSRPEDNGYLENIMFSLRDDGSYDAYLYTYDLTELQIEALVNNIAFTEDATVVSVVRLESDFSEVFNKIIYEDDCVRMTEHEWHSNPDGGPWEVTSSTPCTHTDNPGYCTVTYTVTTEFFQCSPTGGGSNNPPPTGGGPRGGPLGGGTTTFTPRPQPWETIDLCLGLSMDGSSSGYTSQLQDWVRDNNNKPVTGPIANYLDDNNCSADSQEIGILAIENLIENECAIIPSVINPNEITSEITPIFGYYPEPETQLNHEAIKQQYELTRSSDGNLAAVNYLIDTYNMETFGGRTISFDYSISFVDELPSGEPAINIIGYNSLGVMVSSEIKIDTDLFSFTDFGFVTRVIKHELLHTLQGEEYGQNGLSNSLREFDAYYSQIFWFRDLKKIQDWSIIIQLAEYMIAHMNQMTETEKAMSQAQINRVKQTFPKLCRDD